MPSDVFFSLQRPLHSLPDAHQVRAATLSRFTDVVTMLGGDASGILATHNVTLPSITDDDDFINCQTLIDIYEHCVIEFDDPLFGLHLAELQGAEVYGSVLALCRSAATLRDAIRCLIEFIPVIHSSGTVLELAEANGIAELRWSDRSYFENAQANYQGLLLNLKALHAIGGDRFVPLYTNLPAYLLNDISAEQLAQIEMILGCSVKANPGRSCIAFSASALTTPIASASQPLYQLLYGYMYRLKAAPRKTVTEKVHQFVAHTLGNGDLSIDSCAQELGLSSRTLQVRLQEVGKTYSDILDLHRLERAKYILNNASLSIADVADSLGYAERTSFGRAFKRWTGITPQEFRRRTPS